MPNELSIPWSKRISLVFAPVLKMLSIWAEADVSTEWRAVQLVWGDPSDGHRKYAPVDCSSRMWTYSRSAAGTESLLCNCSLTRKQQYYAEQTWGNFTTFTTPSELHFTSRMLEFLHYVPFHCISVCLASQVWLNSIKFPQAQTAVNKQTQTGCVLLLKSNLCLYLEPMSSYTVSKCVSVSSLHGLLR